MITPINIFPLTGPIGLLADSHGNQEAVMACIQRLQNTQVIDRLVHLGDLFDSLKLHDLGELLTIIHHYRIAAVKGNNDFHVQTMLAGGSAVPVSVLQKTSVLSFLEKLPLKIADQNVCFTHSLPFDSIRSLYEPVDNGTTDRARQVFDQTPYHLVCCGHSHSPVLFRWRSGRVTRESIRIGEPVFLDAAERYIIVVGASDNGECGLLDYGRRTYERIRLNGGR